MSGRCRSANVGRVPEIDTATFAGDGGRWRRHRPLGQFERGFARGLRICSPTHVGALGGGLGLWNDLQPPETVREPAFIIIGLAVGLGFNLAALRRAASAAPFALGAIVGIIVACGALAATVAATTQVSLLDAYLATTPGGINACSSPR